MRRTQIYLDEDQAARLDERAAAKGTTRSHVIREAIDGYLERPLDRHEWRARWRSAVRATAGIAPYLPPGSEYVERFRAAGARKLDEIERRRRE